MKWIIFSPELFFFISIIAFFLLSMAGRPNRGRDHIAAICMAGIATVISLAGLRSEGVLFAGTYRVDLFSQVFKILLSIGLFLTVCICTDLDGIEARRHPEFYLLLFTSTLAMMMLVSAAHFLTIYVALELSSYSLYILVSLRKRRELGIEAGLKYFLVGVSASAIMLFGFALLYGSIQASDIQQLAQMLPGGIDRPVVVIGLLLTLCGFFFKLALFPFHFWAPDVYQGAPNQVAAYIATVSKVAAMAIILRFVAVSGGKSAYLVHVLVTLSIVSMTVGNLAAIIQKDLKRLLAYSSIAHAGYVMIGILSMTSQGYAGTLFYAIAVLLMKFTSFLVLVMATSNGENLMIADLAGLHRRSPILAMALMLSLFSLAGIPPTIGFTGKFLIFAAAMQKGYFTLVLIAMINVVISLYYYLMVIKAAYLLEPAAELP
ncbi:MAG: NADH-quinone oxidoreductase subunit N, partial [Desulfobacterales bacterium]